MTRLRLIFCLGGNRRFSTMARQAGWWTGARLPTTLYEAHRPLAFADQNWGAYQKALARSVDAAYKRRKHYMQALAEARPLMASVLDWEYPDQLSEVLDWAAEAAQFSPIVMLIPKVVKAVDRLPDSVAGRPVVLGYSIPTTHGGTKCGLREFDGRRVHLLGGSPRQQLQAAYLLREKAPMARLVSADGNMIHQAAGMGTYWTGRQWRNDGALAMTTDDALQQSLKSVRQSWIDDGWELEPPPPLVTTEEQGND